MRYRLIPFFIRKIVQKTLKDRYYDIWKNNFYNQWKEEFYYQRIIQDKSIPKIQLKEEHVQNATLLLNRLELLKKIPSGGVAAEIGVDRGDFSQLILEVNKPRKLHLIDAWGDSSRYHDGLKTLVEDRFTDTIKMGTVELNIGLSTDVLSSMPNDYFDWVYLDTDHTYSVTAEELSVLKSKMKPHGIIAGHDYIIGNWVGDCRYGVIEAVHELCVLDQWELLYLTINKEEMPSFAIRKLYK